MRADAPPAGYVEITVGNAHAVCVDHLAGAMRVALRDGTLYEYAKGRPDVGSLAGRGTSYAVSLPGEVDRVVVRHNRHGGMLAALTRDLFRPPTRAPLELQISERLRQGGVSTPQVLGYVVYPAHSGLQRADVMTREIPHGADLSAALLSDDSDTRARSLRATAELLRTLERVGARHHDLNIKNVLLQALDDKTTHAFVLDVDRVVFSADPAAVRAANLTRLLRSARKWQSLHGARVTDAELAELSASVYDVKPTPATTLW